MEERTMTRIFIALFAALSCTLFFAIFLAVVVSIVIGITNFNHAFLHWSLTHMLMALGALTFVGLVFICDKLRLDD
jgi:low affinity Fe/Cu permease